MILCKNIEYFENLCRGVAHWNNYSQALIYIRSQEYYPLQLVLPHWNWEEGTAVDVHCYSSVEEVELFLNGKSLGKQKKCETEPWFSNRHVWQGISFEAGELTAVAVGNPSLTCTRKTAQAVTALTLVPEKESISTHPDDLVYLECNLTDVMGTVHPYAEEEGYFTGDENTQIVACDNGCQTDTRTFSVPHCHAFAVCG